MSTSTLAHSSASTLTYPTGSRQAIITLTVILCAIIELIDTSIVNVALNDMAGNLGATTSDVAWVVTSYAISNVIIIPMASFLANKLGRRPYFIGSILLFTASSFLCGHASGIWELVFWRFIQGIGGGALLTVAQTILVESYRPEELDKANALFGLGVVMGPALGPVIGGLLIDNYAWPWIFYVNIPVGLLAAFLAYTYVPVPQLVRPAGKGDWFGIFLLIVGIGSLQTVLEEGQRDDWFESRLILTLTITAMVALSIFVWWQLRSKTPVLNLRLLAKPSLLFGSLLTAVFGFGIFAANYVFPIYSQGLLGWTATATGVLLLPSALATGFLMGGTGGMLKNGVSPKVLTGIGFLVVAYFGYFAWQHTTLDAGTWALFWPQFIRGIGFGLLFVPITSLAMTGLKGEDVSQASGITNMVRMISGSLGISLINTYITQRTALHRNDLITKFSLHNPATQHRLEGIMRGMMAKGVDTFTARKQALAALDGLASQQAALLSFADAFLLIGLVFLLALPLVFFIRREKGEAAVVSMGH
jgi:DHA2 family multidrug resistance protein